MSIGPVGVTNAYNNIQKISSQILGSGSEAAAPASSGFGSMVSEALKDGISTVQNTENVAASAISGKASITDVVSAVNSADIALKTIVTVRDKVIGAYQDIMKMPI